MSKKRTTYFNFPYSYFRFLLIATNIMCCSLVNWRTKETEAFYFAVNLDSLQVVCFDNVISPNSSSVGAVFAITDCSYKSVIHLASFPLLSSSKLNLTIFWLRRKTCMTSGKSRASRKNSFLFPHNVVCAISQNNGFM